MSATYTVTVEPLERQVECRSDQAILDACLRGVPAFVARRKQDDEAEERIEVALPGGPVTLRLSWVPAEA